MSKVVLVICAHPDDEALGIAGTLARHSAEGDLVHFVFLAEGVTARDLKFDPVARGADIAARKEMAAAACRAVGGRAPRFLDLQDNRLDGLELLDIVKGIEPIIEELRPSIVYTNHINDLNIDHRVAHEAVLTACRPLPGHPVRAIYAFETASSTEWEPAGRGPTFHPNRYVDISKHIDAKMAAIKAYDFEMRAFPHPRSHQAIEALWRLRGAQAGMMAAEALMVVRERV